ncbi:peptidyl-tRNA hydrolase 2, mitochondrial [Planoprotostelium fungivorum]|uniref:peptidyl-tRNA hydrolase n=1 Tax=Planoprotostelium fungivorum TaxID=1890364 RepID=A0A2P6NI59_9EUKA|nr:peptidyl-tRNA hydrolase 2, mitochondrial [Planoprotostelium fungivorum]
MSHVAVLTAVGVTASFVLGWTLANRYATQNRSSANSSDEEDDGELFEPLSDDEDDIEPHKMLFLVRTDLKMGNGKITAQVGHATLGAYKQAIKSGNHGQAKIAVKVQSEKDMMDIQKKARTLGILTHVVMDAGRTQVASGTKTVMALGPEVLLILRGRESQLRTGKALDREIEMIMSTLRIFGLIWDLR